MKKIIFGLLIASLLLATPQLAGAVYFSQGDNPAVTSEVNDDAFVAGNMVSVSAPIGGELFAAGNTLSLTQKVARSIMAAGSSITIDQGSGYNTFAVGNNITLGGEYGHDVYVAGSTVTIKEGTVIRGDLRAGAANLVLNGRVEGDVYVGAESVTSKAEVGGEFKAEVDQLTFTGGSVGKDLTYKSDRDAAGLDTVKVAGKTARNELDGRMDDNPLPFLGMFAGLTVANWFLGLLGSLLLGALIVLLMPKKLTELTETVEKNWGQAFTIGILALIVAPIVALLLLFTFIGWKIAFIVMAMYFVEMKIAGAIGTVIAGRYLLGRIDKNPPSWWTALLVGMVVLSLLSVIPFVGWIIRMAIFVILTIPAFGASLLWLRRYTSGK